MMSAGSELRSTPALGVLRSVRVSQVMEPDPPVLPEWMSVQDLVATADRYRPHTAFAIQGPHGALTGVLTGDAVSATDPRQWAYLRLADLAFPIDRVATASVDDPVLSTVQRARSGPTDRVLVLHADGRIAGITGPEAAQRAVDLATVTTPS
jgi:hypothetical protein